MSAHPRPVLTILLLKLREQDQNVWLQHIAALHERNDHRVGTAKMCQQHSGLEAACFAWSLEVFWASPVLRFGCERFVCAIGGAACCDNVLRKHFIINVCKHWWCLKLKTRETYVKTGFKVTPLLHRSLTVWWLGGTACLHSSKNLRNLVFKNRDDMTRTDDHPVDTCTECVNLVLTTTHFQWQLAQNQRNASRHAMCCNLQDMSMQIWALWPKLSARNFSPSGTPLPVGETRACPNEKDVSRLKMHAHTIRPSGLPTLRVFRPIVPVAVTPDPIFCN